MTAPLIRGWCPSLYEPMGAADGLIARVKPFVHGLSSDDLRLIADLAELYGSGSIELTSRANLQVRGLTEASAPHFAAAIAQAGLASADPEAERRRNIQLSGDCGPRLLARAAALETWIAQADALASLPSKFGFAFSAGQPVDADITVMGEDAPFIRLAGSDMGALAHDPLAALQALALYFVSQAERSPIPPRRMKALVERTGASTVFAHAGLAPQPAFLTPLATLLSGCDLHLPFGAMTPGSLCAAAGLADRFGDGRLRLTPERGLKLSGLQDGASVEFSLAASEAGFILDPADPKLRLRACVGRQGCARTPADVRADALALAGLVGIAGLAATVQTLHVSGCVKGCAHPRAAEVTLVATRTDSYDLILNGAPGDPVTYRDLSLGQIAHHLRAKHP